MTRLQLLLDTLGASEDHPTVRELVDLFGGTPVATDERLVDEPAHRSRRLTFASGGEIVLHDGAVVAVLLHVRPTPFARTGIDLRDWLTPEERSQVAGRAAVVKKLKALPVECVARGYLIGSGWKDYQADGQVCGIALPDGLRLADRLPEPIFTPADKAEVGQHDENIRFEDVVARLGQPLAEQLRDTTLALYREAADYALKRGIIIADTKFEFGLDTEGRLHLIDEVLTPDSSRFWPAETWAPGISPPSFDKQFVRDYLETLDWDKTAPGPWLPDEVAAHTAEKYREAERLLTR